MGFMGPMVMQHILLSTYRIFHSDKDLGNTFTKLQGCGQATAITFKIMYKLTRLLKHIQTLRSKVNFTSIEIQKG